MLLSIKYKKGGCGSETMKTIILVLLSVVWCVGEPELSDTMNYLVDNLDYAIEDGVKSGKLISVSGLPKFSESEPERK
jgi:hypothetical protein